MHREQQREKKNQTRLWLFIYFTILLWFGCNKIKFKWCLAQQKFASVVNMKIIERSSANIYQFFIHTQTVGYPLGNSVMMQSVEKKKSSNSFSLSFIFCF